MKKAVTARILTLDGEKTIAGYLTTEHPASSYGQPVFVDDDGQAYDSWQVLNTVEN